MLGASVVRVGITVKYMANWKHEDADVMSCCALPNSGITLLSHENVLALTPFHTALFRRGGTPAVRAVKVTNNVIKLPLHIPELKCNLIADTVTRSQMYLVIITVTQKTSKKI